MFAINAQSSDIMMNVAQILLLGINVTRFSNRQMRINKKHSCNVALNELNGFHSLLVKKAPYLIRFWKKWSKSQGFFSSLVLDWVNFQGNFLFPHQIMRCVKLELLSYTLHLNWELGEAEKNKALLGPRASRRSWHLTFVTTITSWTINGDLWPTVEKNWIK